MATPLDTKDAEGISGRTLLNGALKGVDDYRQVRNLVETPADRALLPEFERRAREGVSAAWDHPDAARAMRARGGDKEAMMEALSQGKLQDVDHVLMPAGARARHEVRRVATSLTTPDEQGVTGRDWMDRAKETVADIQFARDSPDAPRNRTVESFREDARYAIADAWQHPEAAKAMQAAGLSERGMKDDLNAGRLAVVMGGLLAPDPAMVQRKQAEAGQQAGFDTAKPQDAVQARRDDVRQAAADYRAKLMAAAPPQPEKAVQSETQGRRVIQRV